MARKVSLAPTVYTTTEVARRPKSDTPLAAWLEAHNVSAYSMAKQIGLSPLGLDNLKFGRSIPTLVTAFKIERVTNGGVPAESWLGTDLGRAMWNKDSSSMWKDR